MLPLALLSKCKDGGTLYEASLSLTCFLWLFYDGDRGRRIGTPLRKFRPVWVLFTSPGQSEHQQMQRPTYRLDPIPQRLYMTGT